MMTTTNNKLMIFIALCFAIIAGAQARKAYIVLTGKAHAQAAVTESVQRFKQDFVALSDTVAKWDKNYRHQNSVDDFVSLLGIVDLGTYGLTVNPDTITLYKIEALTMNGMPIGLTKVCLASGGSGDPSALQVVAPDFRTLFGSIEQLTKRPDIHIGNIAIKGEKATPAANLGDFCVLLRK